MGDNSSQLRPCKGCNAKTSAQNYVTHLFPVTVPVSPSGSIYTEAKTNITRMHSSRMRTARCSGRLPKEGGVCPGWCLPRGGEGEGVGHGGVCPGGGAGRHPPVNRMTYRCKNITLPQLRYGLFLYSLFIADNKCK